jgi:predicted nucleotidyltransferase
MRQQEALDTITRHETAIKDFGVKSLMLFGSVARNEAHPR